jgi:hypothetical protein
LVDIDASDRFLEMMRLVSLEVADDPRVWADLGFDVAGNRVQLGAVDIICSGASELQGGIVGWSFDSFEADEKTLPSQLDGIKVHAGNTSSATDSDETTFRTITHPNGVSVIDHVVVSTPDLDRTIKAFESAGLPCRRQRERTYGTPPKTTTMRQAFFWLGDPDGPPNQRVICEVVGPKELDLNDMKRARSASFFGLALTSCDLDSTAIQMGNRLKRATSAVQAGRRIATVSSIAGSSVAIAIMSPHSKP